MMTYSLNDSNKGYLVATICFHHTQIRHYLKINSSYNRKHSIHFVLLSIKTKQLQKPPTKRLNQGRKMQKPCYLVKRKMFDLRVYFQKTYLLQKQVLLKRRKNMNKHHSLIKLVKHRLIRLKIWLFQFVKKMYW